MRREITAAHPAFQVLDIARRKCPAGMRVKGLLYNRFYEGEVSRLQEEADHYDDIHSFGDRAKRKLGWFLADDSMLMCMDRAALDMRERLINGMDHLEKECLVPDWDIAIHRSVAVIQRYDSFSGAEQTGVAYLPCFDGEGEPRGRHFEELVSRLSGVFQGQERKLYIYNSGNSYHGYVDTLLDWTENKPFLGALKDNKSVDQRWLNNGHHYIRWNAANGRIEPKLIGWHYL
jgi:hypothetical protein